MNLLPENHYEHEMMNRALRENESLRRQLAVAKSNEQATHEANKRMAKQLADMKADLMMAHEAAKESWDQAKALEQQLAECQRELAESDKFFNAMKNHARALEKRLLQTMGEFERCQKDRDELAIQLEAGLHIANVAAMAAAKIKHDIPPIAEVEWLVELAPLIDNWLGMHKAHGISDFKHKCVAVALAKVDADKTGEQT